jgi:hypothetical protein
MQALIYDFSVDPYTALILNAQCAVLLQVFASFFWVSNSFISQRFLSKNRTTAQKATAIATGKRIHVDKPSCSVACMVVWGVVGDGAEVGSVEGFAVDV